MIKIYNPTDSLIDTISVGGRVLIDPISFGVFDKGTGDELKSRYVFLKYESELKPEEKEKCDENHANLEQLRREEQLQEIEKEQKELAEQKKALKEPKVEEPKVKKSKKSKKPKLTGYEKKPRKK